MRDVAARAAREIVAASDALESLAASTSARARSDVDAALRAVRRLAALVSPFAVAESRARDDVDGHGATRAGERAGPRAGRTTRCTRAGAEADDAIVAPRCG